MWKDEEQHVKIKCSGVSLQLIFTPRGPLGTIIRYPSHLTSILALPSRQTHSQQQQMQAAPTAIVP